MPVWSSRLAANAVGSAKCCPHCDSIRPIGQHTCDIRRLPLVEVSIRAGALLDQRDDAMARYSTVTDSAG
jgi:hypothetical protein